MKKVLSLCLACCMAFALVACGGGASSIAGTGVSQPADSVSESANSDSVADTADVVDAADSGAEEDSAEEVTITLSAALLDDATRENLLAGKENGSILDVVVNEDESVTCTMSKSQHEAMMVEITATLEESLDKMLSSGEYPNLTRIEPNENYTEFIVTTTSTEFSTAEMYSVFSFYASGLMYGMFNGEVIEDIRVDYVNADTGEIVFSTNELG